MTSKLSYLNTEAFLQESRAFAEDITHPNGQELVVQHHHTHWNAPFGGWNYYPQPVYYNANTCRAENSSNKKRNDIYLIIPLVIGACATLFCMGQNWAEWTQADNGIAQMRGKRIELQCELNNAPPLLTQTVNKVCVQREQIFHQISYNAKTGVALKAVFAASLGAGAIAVAMSSATLMAAAATTGSISALTMLFRAGFGLNDRSLQKNARELEISISQAERVLDACV